MFLITCQSHPNLFVWRSVCMHAFRGFFHSPVVNANGDRVTASPVPSYPWTNVESQALFYEAIHLSFGGGGVKHQVCVPKNPDVETEDRLVCEVSPPSPGYSAFCACKVSKGLGGSFSHALSDVTIKIALLQAGKSAILRIGRLPIVRSQLTLIFFQFMPAPQHLPSSTRLHTFSRPRSAPDNLRWETRTVN